MHAAADGALLKEPDGDCTADVLLLTFSLVLLFINK